MHKFIMTCAACAVGFFVVLPTTSADARKVSISGKHSMKDISDHCSMIEGGQFGINANGNYSCVNPSNGNSVSCTKKGKCTGVVSRSGTNTAGPKGVLTGGGAVSTTGSGAVKSGKTQGVTRVDMNKAQTQGSGNPWRGGGRQRH